MKAIELSFRQDTIQNIWSSLNSNYVLAEQKTHKTNLEGTSFSHNAWNSIMVSLKRLEETIAHLNAIKLRDNEDNTIAFDFYEFIMHGCIIVDSIKKLALIFGLSVSLKDIDSKDDIFIQKENLSGTDTEFFRFVRNLCVAHPLETSSYKQFHTYNMFSLCYHVVWTDGFDGEDLHAMYFAPDDAEPKFLKLFSQSFIDYIARWIDFTEKIPPAIDSYIGDKNEEYRNKRILLPEECKSFTDYLENLISESKNRRDADAEYNLRFFIDVFSVKISNRNNQKPLELYKNAIKLAVSYFHNSLQQMNTSTFETTGIADPDERSATELIWEIQEPTPHDSDAWQYNYNLGTLYGLEDGHDNYQEIYARSQLEPMKEWLNRFIVFTNKESNKETLILVSAALYLNALTCNCTLNRNIPHNNTYRP